MKFLILRFSSIGDIVLTSPVVRCLRAKYPEAEIHFATKKQYHSIVAHNPYLHRIHLLEDSLLQLANELKQEQFDFIIDLHHNQRTWVIKRLLNRPSSSFHKINIEKWFMVNFKINRLPDVHLVDRYLATCQSLGVINDGGGLDYFISETEQVKPEALPVPFRNGYIGWVIGAKKQTKKFPTAKIIRTLAGIQSPVILLGGKEDEADGQAIISAIQKQNSLVYNACGKYTLNQSASIVQQAKLIVTNDTGLMHIAAAYKKPIISIWGSTIPEFGMTPYYGTIPVSNFIFEVKGLLCRPCSKVGYDTCPKGHFNCMNKLDEKLLAGKINEMLLTV